MSGGALIVGRDGAVTAAGRDAIARAGDAALLWVHLDGEDAEARAWLAGLDLPDAVAQALVARETRPRTEPIGDGALVNLRGLARKPEDAPDGLVSIRLWAEAGRVISLAYVPFGALEQVADAVKAARVRDPGDLIAALAVAISEALDPQVAALGDTLDACEADEMMEQGRAMRRRIGRARATAIRFRRFVAPQRVALERLAELPAPWLADDDRLHIRTAADRFARMAEELEAIRERAALLHDQLSDFRSELLEQRALVLSIVALVFLPLTFVTGLFGMNVDDIPFAHATGAFWWVTLFCVGIAAALAGYFVRAHWFRS